MVEKADTDEGHCDAILVAGINDMVVADATACLGNVLHSTLVSTLYVVAKGEESIGAEAYTGILGYPFLLLLTGQRLGAGDEELLPCAVAEHVVVIIRDIHVDSIIAVGTANLLNPRKIEHTGMLAQPPNVSLVAGKAGTVNAALLTGTDADGLTVLDIANGVALRVFQRARRDYRSLGQSHCVPVQR